MTLVTPAVSPSDLDHVRALFREHAGSLGGQFADRGFAAELAGLPGEYGPPDGCLLLAQCEGEVAGCVALRRWDEGVCEMKRLFVRPAARGRGVGRALAEAVIEAARAMGYERMWLDTLPSLAAAFALYQSLGFRPIPPYADNPVPGVAFLELVL